VPILPAFAKFQTEAALVGRLLAGYSDLELDLLHCVQIARDDLDSVLKAMFRSRGNSARIDVADALGRNVYRGLNLEGEFADAVSAVRHCLRIRNQFAHTYWYDDNSGEVAFANLEEIAKSDQPVMNLKGLTIRHIDATLLGEQLKYFEFADNLLVWVNYEGRYRANKLPSSPGAPPAAIAQPALYK
jgi:hypothetical protein